MHTHLEQWAADIAAPGEQLGDPCPRVSPLTNLKVLGAYPNDNDELIIAKRGSVTSGSTSFSSFYEIGSNVHVVGLADLTSLYNSSSPIVENEWNCSSGDL